MSNLYEFPNQFRLYDVDGVILDNPNDFIIIHEPDGFSGVEITLSRDDETHGVFYEFSGAETILGFDRVTFEGETLSPYDLIKAVLGAVGVDGRLRFSFFNFEEIPDDYVLQYEGDIDLEFNQRLDLKIDCNVKRVTLGDLFKTRKDAPVNLAAKKAIDGDVITGIEPVEMFLHSKVIQEQVFAEGVFSPPITNIQIPLVFDSIEFDSGSRSYEAPIVGTNPSFFFRVEPISYRYFVEVKMKGLYTDDVGLPASTKFELLLSDIQGATQIDSVMFSSTNTGVARTVPFDITFNVIFDKPSTDTDPTEHKLLFSLGANNPAVFVEFDEISFSGVINTVEDNSIAEVYNPTDVFNQILEVTTNETSIFESDFFDNFGNVIKLTNGYKIRGFSARNVIASFKEVFNEWAKPMFGLGYTIYESSPSVFSIKMERFEFFYQDVEIDFFETVIDGSFIIEVDKDIISNEFNVGYKHYPKSTDENKKNNLDEFNTEQKLLTPIRSVKKKSEYISDAIGSGYKLENQRREQFKEVPSDTVSDDDKLFCIDSVDNDTYVIPFNSESIITNRTNQIEGTLSLLGTYFDIRDGDTINISINGGSVNDGNYDVISVSVLSGYTVCLCASVTATFGDQREVTITLPEDRLRAARNENFEFVNNVISPETIYNAGLNPKYMIKNHALIFNSGFNPKPNTDIITTQDAKLNDEMSCQFKSGQGLYNKDPQTIVEMGGDMALADVNGYSKLFNGQIIKFKTNIGYDRFLSIRNAMLNQSLEGDNFGFIRVKDYENNEHTGFLIDMEYNPLSQEVTFTLKGRFVPSGLSFDYTLDSPLN